MRRSKIKPSINLASRRSVSTPSQSKDKGNAGTPTTPNTTQGQDVAPKPTQERAGELQKPTRERRSSQSERTDAALKKEFSSLIPEVAPEPTSVPLKDTTKQQYSAPQPASDPKDTDEQSTCVSNAMSSVPSGVQETGTKLGPSATRRKRFSTVPNLGQPRLRPSGQRAEATTAARASTELTSHQEQKENEQAVMRPPPVQRVLSVPTTNKKDGAISPAITLMGPDVQKKTAAKSLDVVPIALTKTTSEVQASGDSKVTEGDGKKSAHQANVYSKKLKELKDQMDDDTPSKRRKRHARSDSPDRTKMTMGDLIYYNPRTNRMKITEAEKQNKKAKTENIQKKKVTFSTDEEQVEEDADDDTSSTTTMAPQVKIGPDGEIIIDQKSLYVEASPAKTFDLADSEVVHEDSSHTTYSSFVTRKRTATWTEKDTRRFYIALSAVGTDFTTINAMFPSRTRAEIKRKFKKEERQNRKKVDLALVNRQELDMSLFDPPSDDSDGESVVDAGKSNKKNSRKKNGQVGLDDIAEDVDEQSPEVAEVDETEEQPNLANILSTTKSGRQPKMRTSYTIQIPPKLNRKRTRASPSQNPNALKVFDDYAKHRIQRLQDEHEATMTLKRLARNEVGIDPEEESEDGRSDMTSEMMSEVGSEIGNDDIESVEHAGLTSNLQPMRVFQRNSPSAGPSSSSQLAVGGFSSPESISDPSVKKVTLMITTPDGKQTLVQVNLTSSDNVSLPGSSGAQVETGDARLGAGGVVHTLPKARPAQMPAGHALSSKASPYQVQSPARTLTALTNVSSPYQSGSPQNQKIRTVLSTGETQPSKQSKNVTMAKIMDGKIVFIPSQPSTSAASATSPGVSRPVPEMRPVVNTNPSVQHGLSSIHLSHQGNSIPSGKSLQTSSFLERTNITGPKSPDATPTVAQSPVVQAPVRAPTIPVVAENVSTDNLLTIGSLPDLGMNMTFAPNLDMVAYEESIETIGDHIVAQQVNVASTDPDGVVPQTKRKLKPHEPFIPPIK
ncbi:transcription factor TFIIIB component B'' homolog [Strongylocentrotus purpuratus]|uniref:Myb-like domain-containing protein n=1 Tax=Strongylocentrotus purpuratus TaxID=7668 RepID=A0A7M7GJS8_STRPU|nr:transcription factor TFIIIB component B'' homolog [Strongylocentrotus purpuratus]